jgi:hypothetical protein
MKKILVSIVVLLAVVAIVLPASAFEVKYGGLFRVRPQFNDNLTGANPPGNPVGSNWNDNQQYIDQRLRIFFQFIASENLRLVTGFEMDTLWGGVGNKVRYEHRDAINVELKHAYLDFMIPCTPVRSKIGLQPLAFMQGWIVDEDFTAMDFSAKFDPVTVAAGYISEVSANNSNYPVTQWQQRVDDWYLSATYAQGPFTAGLVGFYQLGRDAGSTSAVSPYVSDAPRGNNDNLFDLGVNLGYKLDWMNAFLNYVQNLGSYDSTVTGRSVNYKGFMIEAGANMFYGPFTFNLGGFVTSGDDQQSKASLGNNYNGFVYPIGRSHYWSEIMGLGTLENTTGFAGVADQVVAKNVGAYSAGDHPSNLWTINAGAAWQALEATKLTFNYYYLSTYNAVFAGTKVTPVGLVRNYNSNSLGHEFDLYLDQKVVDGLMLRLVGAYMIANDAYSIFNSDGNPWELGARLQWSF